MNKSDFSKPQGIYLLNHSVGCLPADAEKIASKYYFQPWKTAGGNAWDSWIKSIASFRQSLAGLFSADEKDFCPQTNVSSCIAKILLALPQRPQKKTILASEHDFPSTIYSLSNACNTDHKIQFLSMKSPVYDFDNWKNKLTKDVDIVLITHVTSNLSQQAPVKEIIQQAKQNEIITIVDIAQSAGVIPIKLREWDADFVVGSCVKWLCGGPGAGFMWVNPNILQQCKPRDVGWFSHADPFEFNVHHFNYANDASRFWGGTPSVLPFIIADKAIQHITHIGVQQIHQHNQKLIEYIQNALREQQITTLSPQDSAHRGGTITIKMNNVEKMSIHLQKNNIYFDVRQNDCFRFSPHIYTELEEIEAFIKIVQML